MDLITLDYETFWSQDFTLTKLTPLEYVMDDRFEAISCAIKINREETFVVWGDEIGPALRDLKVGSKGLLAHNNSGFDAYVSSYRFGLRPKMWLCTLAMARPMHAKTTGLSLAKLVQHYGLGVKNDAILHNTRGRRLADFKGPERRQMEVYNKADTDQCRALFDILRGSYGTPELWQIDAVIRMRTEPAFVLDRALLESAASVERDRKFKALLDLGRRLGIQAGDWSDPGAVAEQVRLELASAKKFSELLASLDVPVPMKRSPSNPEKMVPALAKTDEAFTDLQAHPNETVAAAARARLDVKSTLLETRIQKFLRAGELTGGLLPIPIRYCGADTTGRDSGEEYNPQNLPRIDPDRPKVSDALRRSLRSKPGHAIIVADQSGIELRTNHFLWKVESSMELYQANPAKADLYRAFAALLFARDPGEITKPERQLGKVAQLGLGFGAGAVTFQRVARVMGGIKLVLKRDDETPDDVMTAEETVHAWRLSYANIASGWKACGAALRDIANGREVSIDPWELTHTCKDGIVLPSGRLIRYPDLRQEESGSWEDGKSKRSWVYADGRHKARLTGPKVCENIVQALARDSIFDCAIEFYKRTKLRPALRVHDELVYSVPEGEADALLAELQAVMRTPPTWWPQLVVWSEGDKGTNYGDCK